jgi:hypothetical protein
LARILRQTQSKDLRLFFGRSDLAVTPFIPNAQIIKVP